MSPNETDLNPVDHITTDAIGPPGKRVFYLQGWQGNRSITLIVEKFQVQSLAIGVEQLLGELAQKYPDLPDASADYQEEKMQIHPPVDPQFRVGELGLGYEPESDMVVLIAREIASEENEPEEGSVVRFWCTRDQIRSMAQWGLQVAAQGRPNCPQCGQPMDPEGHFCPKRNGHKR